MSYSSVTTARSSPPRSSRRGRPEEGILAGIATLTAGNGVDLADVTQIIHGTTLATNALIERSGARTALVTTAGFRDVIETRTESRFEQYDLNIVLPAPLIERKDRYVVAERLNARGEVLLPFDEPGARAVVAELVDSGYEAVAVGFVHSYRDGNHERGFRGPTPGSRTGTSPCRSAVRCRRRCASSSASTPRAPTPTCSR